ncbi:conserved hypothetical protein [Rubrivivax sp. A210]|uniref:elongation factor P maturation arginine rhamnosyltransferase EarP n=1 Tax=Rubrivivax sp. A210 TaxID=2772301 RepID=UPI001918C3E3|nr:elongation factor P maturation arginine rhamnosyltransferase EarP [Rubrivivax sp. A210]CAD5372876.1 conserved hypothetical protein [Rubrivivax sp. A210]
MPAPAVPVEPPALQWDLFCRVIDNYGDAGVCWRLARRLAALGQRVRLIIDDAAPLGWMAPAGAAGVEVMPWPGPDDVGDVVVEAFGCDPPAAHVARMAEQARPAVWINLEYLSAEPYVERSHGLPSPQRNGLTKWFFFPGFTAATGGLLREAHLLEGRAAFDHQAWLARLGIEAQPGERLVSLFCYANSHLPALLQQLAMAPTLLLLTPGHAQRQVSDANLPPGLRTARLPWLTQDDFDRLLWACELNFVRGEDSLVRAAWAGAAFAWQAYPQDDGAHAAKIAALLAQMQAPPEMAAWWRGWNGIATLPELPDAANLQSWTGAVQAWRSRLVDQAGGADLAERLLAFVHGKSRSHPAA